VSLVDMPEYRYLLLLRVLGAWWCLGSSTLEPHVLLQHLASPEVGFGNASWERQALQTTAPRRLASEVGIRSFAKGPDGMMRFDDERCSGTKSSRG
jgi:hypothetical protein